MQTAQLGTFHSASTTVITQKDSSNKNFVFDYTQQLHKKNSDPGIFLGFKLAALGHPKHFLFTLGKIVTFKEEKSHALDVSAMSFVKAFL